MPLWSTFIIPRSHDSCTGNIIRARLLLLVCPHSFTFQVLVGSVPSPKLLFRLPCWCIWCHYLVYCILILWWHFGLGQSGHTWTLQYIGPGNEAIGWGIVQEVPRNCWHWGSFWEVYYQCLDITWLSKTKVLSENQNAIYQVVCVIYWKP